MMKKMLSAFLLLAAALLTGCSQVSTGNVGIVVSQGKVDMTELAPGWHLTPFKTFYEINAKETLISLQDLKPRAAGNLVLADFDVDIYAQVAPDKAAEIFASKSGDLVQVQDEDGYRVGFNYLTREAREAVYTAVAQVAADDMNSKRAELATSIQQLLQAELDKRVGKGWFLITNVNVRNIVTDPALEQAIKANAQMAYKIKQKEQAVTEAKLEAERKRAEAQGDADAIRLRAEAVQKQGGAEYVQLEWIKKWNGQVPTYQGGSTPLIQLPK